MGASHAAVVWGAVALVAGPVLGGAGAAWRHARGWPRPLAVAVLAGALLAEGIAFGGARLLAWNRLDQDPGIVLLAGEIMIGLALPAILLDRVERRRGYSALIAIGAVAVVAIGRW